MPSVHFNYYHISVMINSIIYGSELMPHHTKDIMKYNLIITTYYKLFNFYNCILWLKYYLTIHF